MTIQPIGNAVPRFSGKGQHYGNDNLSRAARAALRSTKKLEQSKGSAKGLVYVAGLTCQAVGLGFRLMGSGMAGAVKGCFTCVR